MIATNRKITTVWQLVIWGLLLRIVVYLLLSPSADLGKYANSGPLYFSALTEHFADYFSFTTNIPPATFIIQAWVFKLIAPATAMSIRAFFILVSIADLLAVVLLFQACKKLGSGERFSFWLLCLLSATLVPFELWRDGMHYDHYTFFFTSLFAWTLVRLIHNKTNYTDPLLVSVAGALLVSQSAVNAAIVPFTVLCIFVFVYTSRKQYLKLASALIIALILPFTVLFLVSKKNQREGQESLTSNKAGPAMMMVVQRAYLYDVNKVRQLAKETGAPDWYIWTYDHATPPFDSSTGKQAVNWMNLAQAFGICFYSDSGTGKGPWQFDFDPLIHYLEQSGPPTLLPIARADAEDAVVRPYRYAGFAPEFGPRWIGVYGDVSKKIFFSAIRKNPAGMLRSFVVQHGIFSIYGPLFPYNTTQAKPGLLARAGLRTEKNRLPLQPFFILATLIFAIIVMITYTIMLFNIPLMIWRWIKAKRMHQKPMGYNAFLLLSVPAICVAVVFSCLVGGENDRYYIQLTPYLILLASCLPGWLNNRKRKLG